MIKKSLVALILLASSMAVVSSYAEQGGEEDQEKSQNLWMKKKLDHSQQILAGLVSEDFDAIAKSARGMSDMNQFEKFFRAKSRNYRDQLKIFEIANKELIHQAENENLDGATLAYMQLTTSCINCHKIVRGPKTGSPSE